MKRRIKIYFSPVDANPVVVPKLKKILGTRFQFEPLARDERTRHRELVEIGKRRERCIYLWGDGYGHHDSYYFTLESGARLKLNTDAHQDLVDGHQRRLILSGVGEPEDNIGVNYANHMGQTAKDGVQVGTRIRTDEDIAIALGFANQVQEGEVAHTIDCDVLINFPAGNLDWITERVLTGRQELLLTIDQVSQFISGLSRKVGLMDLGGMTSIPDFTFVGDVGIPTTQVVKRVVWEGTGCKEIPFLNGWSEIQLTQNMINQVGSYGVLAYARFIRVFAETF